MPVPQSFNKILLTTSNTAENNITLQEISGQLYINDHLVVTADNIASLTTVTNIESDVSTLQTDTTSLQTSVSTLQTQVDNITKYNIYSLSFDGTNDYVNVGSVDSALSNTAFSYSFWFKLDTTRADIHSIIAQDNGYTAPNTTRGFFLIFDNRSITTSNRISASVYGSGNAVYKDLRFNELDTPDNNWHHFIFTCDVANDTYQAYLDGSSITPSFNQNGSGGAPSSMYQNNLDLYIGSSARSDRPFKGNIDEVALFNSILSSSEVASLYNSGIPADISSLSPVGYWRMGDNDNGSGTTITDQGSGGNNGTLTNGPTFSTDVPEAVVSFANTYSLSFDGSNDYVDCGVISGLQGSSNGAISVWIKPDTAGHAPNIGYRPAPDHQFVLTFVGGTLYFGVRNGSTANIYTTTAMPNDTNWHHYVATFSSGTVKIYIDGSEVLGTQTGTNPSTISSTSGSFFIGRNGADNKYTYGLLDEASLFNTALSASDVTDIYNGGVPGDISSLNPLGWWRMGDDDGGTGTTITDQGSGGNNGTLTNGPTFSTDVPEAVVSFANTYSLSLDGGDDYINCGGANDFSFTDSAGNDSAFSISAWVKLDSTNRMRLVSKDTSTSNREYLFGTNSDNRFNILLGTASKNLDVANNTTLNTTDWYHVVCTYDGSKTASGLKVYVNGDGSSLHNGSVGSYTGMSASNGSLEIGRFANGHSFFNGLIDEVAVFNSELSSSQVSDIYNSGSPTNISSLSPLGYWRMGDNDGGSGTTITDQGSGANNGTLTNGPTFSTTIPS